MNEVKDYAASLGTASSGRLEFARGAANFTLGVDSSLGDLWRAGDAELRRDVLAAAAYGLVDRTEAGLRKDDWGLVSC